MSSAAATAAAEDAAVTASADQPMISSVAFGIIISSKSYAIYGTIFTFYAYFPLLSREFFYYIYI